VCEAHCVRGTQRARHAVAKGAGSRATSRPRSPGTRTRRTLKGPLPLPRAASRLEFQCARHTACEAHGVRGTRRARHTACGAHGVRGTRRRRARKAPLPLPRAVCFRKGRRFCVYIVICWAGNVVDVISVRSARVWSTPLQPHIPPVARHTDTSHPESTPSTALRCSGKGSGLEVPNGGLRGFRCQQSWGVT